MHDYGKASVTDWVDPQGMKHVLKNDVTWSGDLALNPNFTKFPAAEPQLVPKGSMLHTQCTWNNTTDKNVKFPAEMCVFFGFIYSESDVYCTDNKWNEAGSSSAMMEPVAGAGAAVRLPVAGAGGSSAAAGSQRQRKAARRSGSKIMDGGVRLGLDQLRDRLRVRSGTACDPCFEKTIGLSHACAAARANIVQLEDVPSDCLVDSACAYRDCVMKNCVPFRVQVRRPLPPRDEQARAGAERPLDQAGAGREDRAFWVLRAR